MKNLTRFLMSLLLGCGLAMLPSLLTAQQAPEPQPSPNPPAAQQPQQPSTQVPSQTSPEAQAQTEESDAQVFSGTIVKSGEKYILQMADGTSYNLDHQDLVKKFEGKQVRIKGTLDTDGKTIHIVQ